jgi:hypothetical protein
MILTEDEIRTLTGKHRPSAQMKELDNLGIKFSRRLNGTLVVYSHQLEARQEVLPDFSSLAA